MQRGKIAAGRRGDDGDRVDFLAVRAHPGFRQGSKTDRLPVAAIDEKGPLAAAGILPLVIAVGRNQAAAAPDRVLERRLVPDCLGAGVDQQREFAGVVDPTRHQSPAHQAEMPAAIMVENDHRNRLRRRNIMSRREIGLLGIAEQLPKRRGRRGNDETSAHCPGKISTR
jgi:hypothetical protein